MQKNIPAILQLTTCIERFRSIEATLINRTTLQHKGVTRLK